MALLYPGGTQVFTVGPTNSSRTHYLRASGCEGAAAWSPNGQDIAFTTHTGQTPLYFGQVQIFDISNQANPVASFTFEGSDPTWDPTGLDVVAVDHGDGGNLGLGDFTLSDGGEVHYPESALPVTPEFNPGSTEAAGAPLLGFIESGSLDGVSSLAATPAAFASGVHTFSWFPNGGSAAFVADDSATCDVDVLVGSDGGALVGAPLVTGVGCATAIAVSPGSSQVAFGDGDNVYLKALGSAQAESALTPFATASSAVTEVGWTSDGAYLVYSTFVPDSFSPSQGQLTLIFAPVAGGASRTLTNLGTSFTLFP